MKASRPRKPFPIGQVAIEYLIVVALLALALVAGPDSALEGLFRALSDKYQSFSNAISQP